MRFIRETFGAVIAAAITGTVYLGPLVVAFSVTQPDIIEMAHPEEERIVTLSMEALEGLRDEAPPAADPENIAEQLAWEPEPEPVPEPAAPEAAPEPTPEKTATKTAPASTLTSAKKVQATLAANAAKAPPAKKVEPSKRTPPVRPDAVAKTPTKVPVRPAKPEAEKATAVIRTAADLKKAAAASVKCGVPHPDINMLEKNNFVVQRDLINFYTSTMSRFNSLGWSKRYDSEDNDHKGWYISGFNCKSPLWKGGLRPRDIVQSVNGRKTYNVVQIFALWTTMKKKGDFEVKLIRKGKEVTIHYKVV